MQSRAMNKRIRLSRDELDLALRIRSTDDVELIEELAIIEARESFWAFRCYMDPKLKHGWFPEEVSHELQAFYEAFERGLRPTLVLNTPPQHGKSRAMTDFIAWVLGKNPELKNILASFSDRLGVRANLTLQRMLDSPRYKKVFPKTALPMHASAMLDGRPQRNSEFLELVNAGGSFRNTTVRGPINGEGLDLGFIDDPLKGRQEARSKQNRDNVWLWLTDDFFSRFSEFAGMLMIMTRWHKDDPAGRWIERFPNTRILRYKAIATEDERYRRKGEALFPEHKSLAFLQARRQLYTRSSWESLYQQNPIIEGGDMFPVDKFVVIPNPPGKRQIKATVRYWDKAGTQDGGKRTAGVLMHEYRDGGWAISDVVCGQWGANKRETIIKQTAEIDRATWDMVETWVEQEPGSGGKESAERSIVNLKGHVVYADKVTGDKETRAEPYAAQVQGGNVCLVAGPWNRLFLEDHEEFPNGKFVDQVDAAAGAFNKLAAKTSTYDSSYSWI